MLPKSRILSVLLLGLGVALVAAGLVAPSFLSFSPRLPLDIENTTWTLKDDNAKSQMVTGEGTSLYEGPMTYQLNMDVQDPADKNMATLRIGESAIRGDSGNLEDLSMARVWTYGIDRLSGEAEGPAVLSHTIGSPTAEVTVDGYWLKFPAHAEQTTYPAFDPILRKAVDAVFEEEMEIDGRTVYRYHQEIEPVNTATVFAGNTTTTLTNEDGSTEQGYLFHMGSRDFYVDQETGLVVGMDMAIDDYWGDRTGAGRESQFVFTGSTSEEDRAALLEQAAEFLSPEVGTAVRWGSIAVGALLALLGAAGALGAFGRRSAKVGAHRGDR
ncbi:DUF3068 domain-containing protein [Corynebacterium sp.]|uniref:DUF3068 domain-containing protein n=1 Tax=Corynebacterium sp. TaxID=1720 RepID=UPI0026DBE480|nr:DUF3068 domain-containing protein [Corynebacterium sp.]MDO5032374.1 DUF3068 domain-containing protein [Corynebacterium sp.]